MKTTYLIYPDKSTQKLVVVDQEEWKAIVAHNAGCPKDQRRYFIADIIVDGDEMDCMIIETTEEEHRRWCNERKPIYRNLQAQKLIKFLSIDATFDTGTEENSLLAFLPSETNEIGNVQSDIAMEQLRVALREWRPWAEDMLDFYLSGDKRTCSSFFALRYGISERQVRTYKKQFEDFVKKFLLCLPFRPSDVLVDI